MITRSNLAEQLREYQIRSKNDWASVSIFTSTSNLTSSRVDVVLFVIWELVILAFLVLPSTALKSIAHNQYGREASWLSQPTINRAIFASLENYMIGKQGDNIKEMRQDMNYCLPKQF
ncbi:hypothetical protein V6N11_003305 [Hibiscus sabdariffa]|uniref:K Homology domain-containing protein n=1 Tax=Hibiscus sabdariffa TaxID=183260 RepID=A0ABR2SDQ1_9ROSI